MKRLVSLAFAFLFVFSIGFVLSANCNIVFSSNATNINLTSELISKCSWDKTSAVNIVLTVNKDVVIGSTNASKPAMLIEALPSGSSIKLVNNGFIVGKGGDAGGSVKSGYKYSGQNGSNGGDAIWTNFALIINNSGVIGGGGGGAGGPNGGWMDSYVKFWAVGGMGGGGAGYPAGISALSTNPSTYPSSQGGNGSVLYGGIGGNLFCKHYTHQDGSGTDYASKGGNGGDLGENGENGAVHFSKNFVGNKCDNQTWLDSYCVTNAGKGNCVSSKGGSAGKAIVGCVNLIVEGTIYGAKQIPSTCSFASVCGNSDVEDGEECDDGNLVNGDGCNSSCQIETISSEIYWANMNGKAITSAHSKDMVQLVVKDVGSNFDDGDEVEFEVVRVLTAGVSVVFDSDEPLVGKVVDGDALANWRIDQSAGEFKFALIGTDDESGIIAVGEDDGDSPLFVSIISPKCGSNLSLGTSMDVVVNISDEDDLVDANVSFDGVKIGRISNGLSTIPYTFNLAGSWPILVEAQNSIDKKKRDISNVMIVDETVDGTYVAACISRPGDYEVVDSSSVRFSADGTRGLVYSPTTKYSAVANSSLALYWTFDDGRGNPYTSGSNPLAWNFYKSFTTAGEHSAILNVEVI